MSSNDVPPAPDYSPIAEAQMAAAKESASIAREQLAWAKQVYAENKGVTDQVVDAFLRAQQRSEDAAIKDRQRYEGIYQPLEDDLARDAQDYASEERKTAEMGRASANVAQQFGAARLNAQRDLEAFGVNPAATRFAALDIGVRAQQAAAQAGASNQAAQMVDATGRALRSEAINVGRGYPGQVAGTYNTVLQAGTGANNAGLATTASGANTMGTGAQWQGLSNGAYTGAAGTMHMGYGDQMAQYKAEQESSSGWGTALGLVAGVGGKFLGLPTSSVGGKLLGFAEGGAVPGGQSEEDGGVIPRQVSPSRGKAVDDVPAKVTAGEFIVPKDVVEWFGQKHMYSLIEKADKERAEKKQNTGAIPSIHPSAMGAPQSATKRPPALQM